MEKESTNQFVILPKKEVGDQLQKYEILISEERLQNSKNKLIINHKLNINFKILPRITLRRIYCFCRCFTTTAVLIRTKTMTY